MKLVHKVFIECFSAIRVLPDILGEEEGLGAHSAVFLLTPTFGIQYFWCHPDVRPFGEKLSLQCPSCRVLRSVRVEMGRMGKGILEASCSCGWSHLSTPVKGDVILPPVLGKKMVGWGNSMIYGSRADLLALWNAPRLV
jgi:hypothetical protein